MLFFVLLLLTGIVFLNPILLPAGIRFRMGQTFEKPITYVESVENLEQSLESSARSRIEIWKGAVKMIEHHPFFGVGYGLFSDLIGHYAPGSSGYDAHNSYLLIAAEMGIPTLIVFLWIIFLAFIYSLSLYKSTPHPFTKAVALGFLGGIFGLIMSNMFGSRLDSQEVASYFWILLALIMRFRILDQREAQAPESADPESEAKQTIISNKLDACWSEES